MVKQYKSWCLTIIIFFLLSVSSPGKLLSQPKYTAVLPVIEKTIPVQNDGVLRIAADNQGIETSKAFFKFNVSILPLNAKIGSLGLKLYNVPGNIVSDFSSQMITVMRGPNNTWSGAERALNDPNLGWAILNNNNKPIGRDEVKASSTSLNAKLKIPGSPMYVANFLPDSILSLAVRSAEKRKDTKFYSTKTAEATGNISKKPKLLVKYEVDPYPFRSDWPQAFGTAQHTGYLNWRTNAHITSAVARKLPNASNDLIVGADPTGAIAIYKNQPIIFTQSATGTSSVFAVKQLDCNGNVLWSQAVDEVAKCWPLIDEQGRLYYFSLAGKLTILNLENNGAVLLKIPITAITNSQVSINNNSTIGYDGTLYLATDKGIFAIGAFPQVMVRWKYDNSTNELSGPVALSPDESKACFISVNKQQGTSQLVVVDNMDGTLLDKSGDVLGGYKNDLNYYIPAPVVPNNSGVIVLDGYDNSNQLLFFNLQNGKLSLKTTINAGRVNNTGISKPVVDSGGNVFFVFNNKMARYDELKPGKVDVFNGSSSLDNASILVIDASSNIYALDPYNGANKVFGFQYDGKSKAITSTFELKLNDLSFNVGANGGGADEASRKIGNTKKNLVLAPDQTLYTVTLNNLIAITPAKVSVDDLVISPVDMKTNMVYRASNSITVSAANIKPSVNAVLYSGGSISFKTGFSVTKGARLSCKTGF